jgi:hypothetical protein
MTSRSVLPQTYPEIRQPSLSERRVTPFKAIRLKCLDCCLGSSHEVRLCPVKECTLYCYRFGRKPKAGHANDKMTPLRAIRGKCLDCSADSPGELKHCPIKQCVLYPYRLGGNPNRAGIGGSPQLSARKVSAQDPDVQDREDASEKAA